MAYDKLEAGKWIKPVHKGWKMKCCDCGLVHRVDFRRKGHDIEIRFFRDNRATGQVRRHMKKG